MVAEVSVEVSLYICINWMFSRRLLAACCYRLSDSEWAAAASCCSSRSELQPPICRHLPLPGETPAVQKPHPRCVHVKIKSLYQSMALKSPILLVDSFRTDCLYLISVSDWLTSIRASVRSDFLIHWWYLQFLFFIFEIPLYPYRTLRWQTIFFSDSVQVEG